ncbi:MAG: DNA-directed RNA polymerase subunit N [archaeon]|nr:DNA-directed RNA polymerase subunit N [archaeon]MCP8305953.1 DNA-directed RNA polymerase subunit N [archaeon]
MLIPIRCFTCGSLIGDRYEEFTKRVKEGEEPGKVLDSMGIKRYCCRRMLLSNVDIIDRVLSYYEVLAERRAEYDLEQY